LIECAGLPAESVEDLIAADAAARAHVRTSTRHLGIGKHGNQ
jgi:hypothetical protein